MSPIGGIFGGTAGPSPAPPPSGGVAPTAYVAAFTRYVPAPGFLRIDIEISGGDAYMQITEWIERDHWEEPVVGNEFLLREGNHSIPLVRPAYGWRARSASSSAAASGRRTWCHSRRRASRWRR